MREHYFWWLISKVGVAKANEKSNYILLLHYLYKHDYRWSYKIQNDANRADDGIGLRLLYFQETGKRIDVFDGRPCSILEMLVAFATKIEMNIMGEPGSDNVERWFWEMIHNLKLDSMNDYAFDELYVRNALSRWMDRQFERNGDGSLFPLQKSHANQRKMSAWDQMNAYLLERY